MAFGGVRGGTRFAAVAAGKGSPYRRRTDESVYLAYVDESGDDGRPPKGSRSYALGCVMVDGAEWAAAFDQMIEFRRFVKQRYRIPVRAELKANYLLRNGGPLRARPLSEAARFSLY